MTVDVHADAVVRMGRREGNQPDADKGEGVENHQICADGS